MYGLTGTVSGSTVRLYATNATGILTATDASGFNGTASGTATTFATASTNQAIRGIAYLPQSIAFGVASSASPEPGILPLVAEAGALVIGFGLIRRRSKV